MKYDSRKHHRKSIRLQEYDYSQAGAYFITICTQNRKCLFGEIINGTMSLNDAGVIVEQCLLKIPIHYPRAIIEEFAIMPNHIHFIVRIAGTVGANNYSPIVKTHENNCSSIVKTHENNYSSDAKTGANDYSPLRGTSRTIGSIVRGVKIGVTKQLSFSPWQRNYYEHIVRDNDDYRRIAEYIMNNPKNWRNDKLWIE